MPVGQTEKALSYQEGTAQAVLLPLSAKDSLQQWSVTDLSGSFRFITPFANKAIHAKADRTPGITENNGSDESQLWTLRKQGMKGLPIDSQ